jgi:NAD(P)H-nitrite reductase large subunit
MKSTCSSLPSAKRIVLRASVPCGIMVNDSCQTSDPDIYAIGECASWNNRVYGLVAPVEKTMKSTCSSLPSAKRIVLRASVPC